MKKIIEHGKKLAGKLREKGKRALIITATAGVLAGGLKACAFKNDVNNDKEAQKIAAEYREVSQEFTEESMLTLAPVLLHEDSTKSVIMFSQPGGPKCSFRYKNKDRQDVYSNLSLIENMTVYTVEDGKCTRHDDLVPVDEAKQVLKEITGYME